MKKTRGYILYFDILGYKDILKHNTESENNRIAKIIDQFSQFYSIADVSLSFGQSFDEKKLFVRSFSDNFLFVYEMERKDYMGLELLQCVATRIQYQFLNVGLLTRGSITYGEIYYNKNVVFGLDLIKAVELEEDHREPSIVVDESLKDVYDEAPDVFKYKKEVDLFDVWPNSKLDYQDCLDGIQKLLTNLNKSYVEKTVLEKTAWVIGKLNDYFSEEQGIKYKLTYDHNYYLKKINE